MKKLFLLFLFSSLSAFAGTTTATITLCEKVLDDKQNVIAVHVIVELSRPIPNTDPYTVPFQTNLPPEAVKDVKTYTEKWLNSGTLQDFNQVADAIEKKASADNVAKQQVKVAIDTTGITLDVSAVQAISADPVSDVTPIADPIK